jgi:predicted nucleotidyltransferase component of viral defense system
LPTRLAALELAEAVAGHNDSSQYNGRLAYQSLVTGEGEHIKIELSLREESIQPSELLPAKTVLRDPHSAHATHPGVTVRALSVQEAYAEKIRAALTRKEPAIRDFFDIAHAQRRGLVDFGSQTMRELVAAKLRVTGTAMADLSELRLTALQSQLATQLSPVLRRADYDAFDLWAVVGLLQEITSRQWET